MNKKYIKQLFLGHCTSNNPEVQKYIRTENHYKKVTSSIMKILSLITIVFFVNIKFANAEVFTIAQPHESKQMMLGVEGQSNIDPDNTRINGYFAYGIDTNWNLILKTGFGTNDPMLGADVQYYFADFEIFQIAFKGGLYYLDDLFANFTPIITRKFDWVSLSVGLALNLQLTEDTGLGTNIYSGLNFPINKKVDIRVEGGLKLTDNHYNWLSGGLAYYF